jgi:hypothetical protein
MTWMVLFGWFLYSGAMFINGIFDSDVGKFEFSFYIISFCFTTGALLEQQN